jgi:hypothetical protein
MVINFKKELFAIVLSTTRLYHIYYRLQNNIRKVLRIWLQVDVMTPQTISLLSYNHL